jgi:hypothetical protein
MAEIAQLLTAAIILYCTMAWLRAGERGHARRQPAVMVLCYSFALRSSARSDVIARALWLLTAPVLMPSVTAICSSDRSA